jgi:leucine dehydrogenase
MATTTIAPPAATEHEQLLVRHGSRSGVVIVLAIHSTALGPALGGCRMYSYPRLSDALDDAKRLSQAMTLKAAIAGLDLGGGKGVICLAPDATTASGARRRDILLDFADAVESLGGAYITAEDVGTSADDMVVISERTRHVAGLPVEHGGSGDPSPFTAEGLLAAMRASCRWAFGSSDLTGRSVAVVGCGHVGAHLARGLAAAGAELVLADVDPDKREPLADLPGAHWTGPAEALVADVDMVAPCALGRVIDASVARRLRCAVVCGAANNQLADDDLATDLAARGILYAPDFVVNAGGLINISTEIDGYDSSRAHEAVAEIEPLLLRIFALAGSAGTTPLSAARRLAARRLGPGTRPPATAWRPPPSAA